MGERKLATMTRVMERANNIARWSKDYFEDALCYKLFKGSCNEVNVRLSLINSSRFEKECINGRFSIPS